MTMHTSRYLTTTLIAIAIVAAARASAGRTRIEHGSGRPRGCVSNYRIGGRGGSLVTVHT
jgi:hypothetical protein